MALRASLLCEREATSAWHTFQKHYDFDDLYPHSIELLPLICRNLESFPMDDKLIGKMKGLYRKTWYRNQLLLQQLVSHVSLLEANDIEAMVIKKAALTLQFYKDQGLRTIDNFELLVREDNFHRADALLAQAGLSRSQPDQQGRYLALEGRLLNMRLARCEDLFWLDAVWLQIFDTQMCVLAAHDQLIHSLLTPGASASMWIADCITVAKSGVDVGRLLERICTYRIATPVTSAVVKMCALFSAAGECEVLAQLKELPPSPAEKMDRAAERLGKAGKIYFKVQGLFAKATT